MAKKRKSEIIQPGKPAVRAPTLRKPSFKIRRMHDIGMKIIEARTKFKIQNRGRGEWEKKWEQIKERHGIGDNFAYKAEAFTEAYSLAELNDLCDLCDGSMTPLRTTHVICLSTIPHNMKSVRTELQSVAVKNDWSARQLLTEIQARCGGKRKSTGRPFAVKDHLSDIGELQRLVNHCDSWLRYYETVCKTNDGSDRPKKLFARLTRLPPSRKQAKAFGQQLEKAKMVLQRLNAAVAEANQEIERIIPSSEPPKLQNRTAS